MQITLQISPGDYHENDKKNVRELNFVARFRPLLGLHVK